MPSRDSTTGAEAQRASQAAEIESVPWVVHGLVSGALGALVVAVFFLLFDLWNGRPFWTPAALGSALFLGEPLAAGAGAPAVLVIGYTAVHGAVFAGLGLVSALLAATASRRPTSALAAAALKTALLFACFEAVFLGFEALFPPGHPARLGAGAVTVANLLAAAAMAVYLVRLVRPPARL